MAKALSELRTHTRVFLDEQSAADWTDAQVDREVNYAYMQVYTAVIETYEDYYRTRVTTGSVEDQQEYELPDDFYKVRRVEIKYASDGEGRKAEPYVFDQQSRSLSATNQGSTARPLYYLNGNFMGFTPVPSTTISTAISMWYIKQVPELTENGSEIDIPFPNRYASLIPLGAAGMLLRKGQQEEAVAAKYLEDFAIGLEKMKQELEERFADGNKYIQDTIGDWNNFGASEQVSIVLT